MNKKDKTLVMRIILFFLFPLAQNPAFEKIVGLTPYIKGNEKICAVLQITCLCIYIFLCIYFTKDKFLIENWCSRIPFISQISNFVISLFIAFFVLCTKIPFIITEFFSFSSSSNEITQIKKEISEQIWLYNNGSIHTKILTCIGGLALFMMLLAYFFPQNLIQMFVNILSFILNFVVFLVVCANIEYPFTLDYSDKTFNSSEK